MFKLIKKNNKARRGEIHTEHGIIQTPAFMPVATTGIIKSLTPNDILQIGVQTIITNTYHLYLRPTLPVINKAGGIHKFSAINKPIFTDSGGFQVLSLSGLRKIKENGIVFQSHIDGSYHEFTPENNVAMQREIGSDVMMVLDECTEYPTTEEYAKISMERTIKWAQRARDEFLKTSSLYGYKQFQFGIVQGSVYPDLRIECADKLREMDFDGYAIGGVAIGETNEKIKKIINMADELLPENKPRYLMGVGKEEDIIFAVNNGIDIFDCVIPTRNGRNGTVFTKNGRLLMRNAQYKEDFSAVDENCDCFVCKNYSKAFLHHLFKAKEITGSYLASYHNIYYYMKMMQRIRDSI